MKKILIISILSIFLYQAAFSQMAFGVKAGANLTNIGLTNIDEDEFSFERDIRLSYHLGVFSSLDFTKKTAVVAEILYSSKGFSTTGNSADKTKINFHYIALPVLLNYKIKDRLNFEVGPELDYLVSARSKHDGQSADIGFIYRKKFDLGLDAGLKYSVDEKVNLGIRYNYGLLSVWGNDIIVTNEQGYIVDSNPKIQNRVIQASIVYILNKM